MKDYSVGIYAEMDLKKRQWLQGPALRVRKGN